MPPVASAMAAPAADAAAAPMVDKLEIILPIRIWRAGVGVGSVKIIWSVELIGSIKIGKTGRGGEGPWRNCYQRFSLARQCNTEGCSNAGAQQARNE